MSELNLNELNPPQREAVCHDEGPLLVLAGAGSGKTRVVTYRISRLILEKGISASRILAVTFTNKAAREMTHRIEEIVGGRARGLWIGTFHAMCARILRRHADRLGYTRDFTIYATDEQRQLIKRIVADLNWDPNKWKPAEVNGRISRAKSHLITPERMMAEKRRHDDHLIAELYQHYQEALREANAVDFDDLLNLCVVLFSDHEDVLAQFQTQFEHVIVDEYQDANEPQDILTRVLALPQNNLCVVGDDDQSIYRWRGAQFKNILNLPQVYKDLKVVRLEENYRSTPNILNAAYAVISKNEDRHDKKIWTGRKEGEAIRLLSNENEEVEAQQVVRMISEAIEEEVPAGEIAVLYRTNAQSRVIEDALVRARVPYKVVGGFAFYQRKEVRDLLSYLKMLIRPHDDVSFLRIVNTPRRGIGQTTIRQLQSKAGSLRLSLYETAKNAANYEEIGSSGATKLRNLIRQIQGWGKGLEERSLADTLTLILKDTEYEDFLRHDEPAKAEAKVENVKELVSAMMVAETEMTFESTDPWDTQEEREEKTPTRREKLEVFLERATLESDTEEQQDRDDVVSLMTLHAAKGLEFQRVFMTGVEEGLFPHQNSADSKEGLEEERRLCYVGMTRAKDLLTLSFAHNRRVFGTSMPMRQSRFLEEIPQDLLEPVGGTGPAWNQFRDEDDEEEPTPSFQPTRSPYRPPSRKPKSSSTLEKSAMPPPASIPDFLQPGKAVRHRTFGLGRVLRAEGSEPALKVTVDFKIAGKKTVVQKFAKLEPA
ncbi:MAG: UvrD-helicase domain-containing protein [Candidatus Omnitrophica bacterium]|nr:UvrD-helicase domain-containing protein [Candidatus Omnitrophota bacterium]